MKWTSRFIGVHDDLGSLISLLVHEFCCFTNTKEHSDVTKILVQSIEN
jgi:hypothetical protein